jgi:hypothetical protein
MMGHEGQVSPNFGHRSTVSRATQETKVENAAQANQECAEPADRGAGIEVRVPKIQDVPDVFA